MEKRNIALVLFLVQLAASWGVKLNSIDENMELISNFRVPEDLPTIAMVELEEHENRPTPPFSVCKFLLESAAPRVSKGDQWKDIAKHIADVRANLPEHVRTACDAFIKRNRDDIVALLQYDDGLESQLVQVGDAVDTQQQQQQQQQQQLQQQQSSSGPSITGSQNPQDVFRQFWEQKGQFCGACLTLTKKIQKWLSLNCTQTHIADRVVRMCETMTGSLKEQCSQSRVWIQEYILKNLFSKLTLPNHCAYIGLCEKTMVIRSLANPVTMSDRQTALIQGLEGVNPNLEQEGETVLQVAHNTPTTAPEVTFDLSDNSVSYRDVDKSSGSDLPKIYIDPAHAPSEVALLETGASVFQNFDMTDPNEPRVRVYAQDESRVNVGSMHDTLSLNGETPDKKTFKLQPNHLPIETKYLKACAACQFTVGALFEFMSNPRTVRIILPVIKEACGACNSPDEVSKCKDFVETQGVAFYQDVIRQGLPSKWCPRLELCEIQYFHPSPMVLTDAYHAIESQLKAVDDF